MVQLKVLHTVITTSSIFCSSTLLVNSILILKLPTSTFLKFYTSNLFDVVGNIVTEQHFIICLCSTSTEAALMLVC